MSFRSLGSFLIAVMLLWNNSASPLLAKDFHKIWNLSEENAFFIGREEHLAKLGSFFKKNHKIAAITGGPGFGKTQTAKKFVQNSRHVYDVIWWMDAQQNIPSQFEKMAEELNKILPPAERINPASLSPEALVETVKDILRLSSFKWLLVFDNAESYGQVEKFMPVTHRQKGKNILLTSRNATILSERVEIGVFKRSESKQLVRQALPEASDADIEALVEKLRDYPLGLTIAVTVIKEYQPMTIPKYISSYLPKTINQSNPHLQTSDPLLDGYVSSVQAPLRSSLKLIARRMPEALDTLRFMSLLNSKDVPEEYIDIWLEKTNVTIPPAAVIKRMKDQSLIEIKTLRKEPSVEPLHFFSLHDLIHQLIQENIPVEDKQKLIEDATKVMLEVFSGPSAAFTKKSVKEPIHLLHAQKLCEQAKKIGYSSPALLTLKICLFQCLMSGARDFEKAQTIRDEIEVDFKAGIQVEPYYKALCQHNKGFLEAVRTNFDDAIRYVQEGLDIFEKTGDYPTETLGSINNLIQFYAMRGELEKAASFVPSAQEKLQKTDYPMIKCSFLYVFSFLLLDQGKFQEVNATLAQAKNHPTLAEDNPPIYHAILLVKIMSLLKQKKLEELRKTLQEYESTTNLFFQGRNNSALSHILLHKSLLAMESNKVAPSLFKDLEEALKVYHVFFKGDKKHKMQARVYYAIGKAHHLKGDFDRALENYLVSDEVYSDVLKNKRIDDVSELYKALVLLGVDANKEKTTSKYLRAHIDTFGEKHPRTAEIVLYLDERGVGLPF